MEQLKDCFEKYSVSTVYAPDVEKYETAILYPDEFLAMTP